MKIFKELKKLGYKHYAECTIEELDDLPLNSEERIMEQALVLRWFREKYSLQCFPMQDSIDVWWCLFSKDVLSSGYLLKDGDYGHCSDEHLEFKTYEEAELECLKKLIEICRELK